MKLRSRTRRKAGAGINGWMNLLFFHEEHIRTKVLLLPASASTAHETISIID